MGYINAYLSFFIPFFPSRIKWVCRESSIASLNTKKFRLSWLFSFFYRFYNRYDSVVCQSEAMAEDLIRNYNVDKNKIKVINNPINIHQAEEDKKKTSAKPVLARDKNDIELLFVGTFSKVKRVTLLPQVMALLPENYFLTMVGGGPYYNDLVAEIGKNNVGSRVQVVTNCFNPFPYYSTSRCLLLCSQFEGFPNVILEAFSCGCPAIGYDIIGGANELLANYGGFIADGDLQHFADKIREVIEKKDIDRQRVIEECNKKFSIEKIIEHYYTVL